jgi:uncharacterized protein YqgC (DUF456 family)
VHLIDLLVGLAILVGLVGIVLPVLPGTLLILGAVLVWAAQDGSTVAWGVFGLAAVLLVVGALVKYTVPGRRLEAAGVPRRSLMAGGLVGIVGFFVVPVIGLFLGFMVGVYLAEALRLDTRQAWPSTKHAVKAASLSILIELAAGLFAATVWLVGVAFS